MNPTLKKLLQVKLYRLCQTFNKLDVDDKNGNWDKICEKVKIKMDLAEKIVSIKKRLNK